MDARKGDYSSDALGSLAVLVPALPFYGNLNMTV
jgi:hypothetical protein